MHTGRLQNDTGSLPLTTSGMIRSKRWEIEAHVLKNFIAIIRIATLVHPNLIKSIWSFPRVNVINFTFFIVEPAGAGEKMDIHEDSI